MDLVALWAQGRLSLGLTDADFWELTLRGYGALMEVAKAREQLQDLRAGMVAATVANCHRGKDTQAFGPADFFPGLKDGRAAPGTLLEVLVRERNALLAAARRGDSPPDEQDQAMADWQKRYDEAEGAGLLGCEVGPDGRPTREALGLALSLKVETALLN